jgi:hypothetical protein
MSSTIEENAVALKVLIAAAKAHPEEAANLWHSARIILNTPVTAKQFKAIEEKQTENQVTEKKRQETNNTPELLPLKAEFDYEDENGSGSHRTIVLLAFHDGRDIKRNGCLPVADRYGYLLVGYCTLTNQIRSFRSSRISNLRTFTKGEPLEPNRRWFKETKKLA